MPEAIDANISEIPTIYFNGFDCSINVSDVTLTLRVDTEITAVLKLSHQLAKTLALIIGGNIAQLELDANYPIHSIFELQEMFKKADKKIIQPGRE